MSKIKFLLILGGAMLSLGGCSTTNVSGEWDCPRQLGYGCITIDEADQIAMQRLKYKEHSSSGVVEKDKIIQKKKEYKVWLAPYTDRSGNKHEASTAYYYEEGEVIFDITNPEAKTNLGNEEQK